MNGLNLVKNEVIGYRVVVDSHNWNVALAKRHGENSKNAGEVYYQILSHHKNLEHALLNIHTRIVRDELLEGNVTNELDDLQKVAKAIEVAKEGVSESLHALLSKLDLSDTKIRQGLLRFGEKVENMESAEAEDNASA